MPFHSNSNKSTLTVLTAYSVTQFRSSSSYKVSTIWEQSVW